MLNTLAQFVALSLFWGNPLKINRKFALLLNFHFNHGALTHIDVFTEVINSYTNNTRVFTFYPTKFVTAKRRGDLTWKSSWNRRQFFCVTIVIGVGVVKQNLSCNYISFHLCFRANIRDCMEITFSAGLWFWCFFFLTLFAFS